MEDLKKLKKWCDANARECVKFEKRRAEATEYTDAIELQAMALTYRKVALKIKQMMNKD